MKIKKIRFFIVIILFFTLSYCTGQKNKNELKKTVDPIKKIENNKSNVKKEEFSFFSGVNNQISQVVRTIFQDSKGNIWFGGEGGAFRYSNNSLTHIDSIRSKSGKRVTIKDIAEDNKGKIWIGHTDGISSVDGNNVKNYYESDGLISNDVWCITTDRNNKVWIGTIEGVCKFDGNNFTSFELPEGEIDTTKGISSTRMVHNIFEDSNGTLWFSSNAGLFSYVNNSLTNVSEKSGIKTSFINEIFEDSNGKFWVSTKKGLYNLTENKAINITESKIENGKGIGNIAEDKDGKIWFVSNQHYLYNYDGKNLIEIQKSEKNKRPVIFQIYKDQNDRLWFVGFGGVFRLEDGKFINITKNGPW